MKAKLTEFILFGMKQARSCIFAGSFFLLLALSHIVTFGLPRYDFIFVGAVIIQIILIVTKIETLDEAKTILLFHLLGFTLEVFKTNPAIGSWSYPEFGYIKIANVPLYSGFMYAAVGSYIAQAWRILKLKLINQPTHWLARLVALLIYLNFFTHHFLPDIRYFLAVAVLVIFRKTKVEFQPYNKKRYMSLPLSFVLIGFFIWIAENMATFLGAWKYPNQMLQWTSVSFHKVGAWSLLVIISFILIAELKTIKQNAHV